MRSLHGVSYEVLERGNGRPVLLLHGFTGTAGWISRFPELPVRFVAPTLLQHGATGCQPVERAKMSCQVKDLSTLLDMDDGPWTVIGYSLGGRIGMTLAAYDNRVDHFIGISTTPGLDAAARRQRRLQDAALADFIEREGLEAFIDRWERLPLWHQTDEMRAALRVERLSQQPAALANSLRAIGTGSMPSLWPWLDRLPRTDLIVGEYDLKFQQIARSMQLIRPDIEIHEISGASHAPHIENGQQFGTMIKKLILGGI